jgi:serine phosphatase RsbU (regulator of sigma subunit)
VRISSERGAGRDQLGDLELVRSVADTGVWRVLPDHGPTQPAQRIALPVAAGRGVLVLGLDRSVPFDESYRSFVEISAGVVGTALDSAIRRASELGEERLINETLQEAMLRPAADLPTVAARYVPASGRLAVGGDWYDVIDLGAHRRGLVVGDCVGHGLKAAAVMGPLRSASRALLFEGRSPAAVLDAMDRFAESIDASCTTMVCAVVDLDRGTLTYASAGHPPTLLLRSYGTVWLEDSVGPPLAVPGSGRTDAEIDIGEGDLVVLYSDGLVERRGESIDVGLKRLETAALARYGAPVQSFIDGLLDDLLSDDARDDVVVVVKEVPRTV